MATEIKKARNSYFRNNEHFQFHTELRNLVNEETPENLKIVQEFASYLTCCNNEDIALQKIAKSSITEDIDAINKHRGLTFRGMAQINKAAFGHFDPDIVAAAKRLQVVFDTYGNIPALPLNEETSAIYNLTQELTNKHSADVIKMNLDGWITSINGQNAKIEALIKSRNDENASRTELKMKQTRVETDRSYSKIVTRIGALTIVEGPEAYESFIKKLNTITQRYNNIVAQRRGRNKDKE